jgi:hypothetical protein
MDADVADGIVAAAGQWAGAPVRAGQGLAARRVMKKKSEIRSLEGRMKPAVRNPRSEQWNFENNRAAVWSYPMPFWISGFGFLSDFEFRPSDFRQ